MNYQSGEFVLIKKTKKVKKINEIENISNENILYMSDNTSYSENQVEKKPIEEIFFIQLKDKNVKIDDFIDCDKLIELMCIWWDKKSPDLVCSPSRQTRTPLFTRFWKWVGFSSFQRIRIRPLRNTTTST